MVRRPRGLKRSLSHDSSAGNASSNLRRPTVEAASHGAIHDPTPTYAYTSPPRQMTNHVPPKTTTTDTIGNTTRAKWKHRRASTKASSGACSVLLVMAAVEGVHPGADGGRRGRWHRRGPAQHTTSKERTTICQEKPRQGPGAAVRSRQPEAGPCYVRQG